MTLEVEYVDEIPEGDGPYEKGLWAEARHWVGLLATTFGSMREIALVGLSRRLALRCKNWLWSIEGIVRRLIIAAALALDPASLKPRAASKAKAARKAQTPEPETPAEPSAEPQRPASAFRVLGLHGRPGVSRGPQASPRAKPAEHRHLIFPADDLLCIGAALIRRSGRTEPGLDRPHPLDRRGRASRWDPDYSYDDAQEKESCRSLRLGYSLDRIDLGERPPPKARRHRDIHDPYRFGSGGMEWRRIADEWSRIIPAPDLAGRIMALHRVMLKPERWIERTARLIQAVRRLPEVLRAMREPKLDKPARDRGAIPPGLDVLSRSHAQLLRLDTS